MQLHSPPACDTLSDIKKWFFWKTSRFVKQRGGCPLFFRKDYATPGPGIDPDAPEKTGPARLLEIVQIECVTLLKLNLLFLLTCIPIITIPPALFALNQVIRRMVLDQPVDCVYHYRTAFRQNWKTAYGAFFLVAFPLVLSSMGAGFYLQYAVENPLFLLPFALCLTILLVTLLSSVYLYGVLSTGRTLRESVRPALILGIGRPLRAILAVLCTYGLFTVAVLAFPISFLYLLLMGFSVPCLLGNFFLRTVLKQALPLSIPSNEEQPERP
jgi:uncharacterized membrane protein YesL